MQLKYIVCFCFVDGKNCEGLQFRSKSAKDIDLLRCHVIPPNW
jgi:hypothetical protein